VVHYDLAWNPTRHEQREGRVDRFGQPREIVRAVTLYGRDNKIDGIVLNVLLRKHDEIRKALGVSVPVPDNSDTVVEAVLEGLLLREAEPEQLVLEGVGAERRTELHREWESAAEKEKLSRTKYAQLAIQPAEVARELADVRAGLGTSAEVAAFVHEALQALGVTCTATPTGFTAMTAILPIGLRDALTPGHAEPLPFHRDLPVPRREALLDRTDSNVQAIARHVLDTALDPTVEAWQRPARRCGVVRTDAVARRTTLLLLRYRFHLTVPGRNGERPLVAEDARVVGYRGSPEQPQWLTDKQVADLLAAQPSGNIAPDQARDFLSVAVDAVPLLHGALDAQGVELAEGLRAAHVRVREAAGQRVRRQVSVRAQRPADVLGVYVYLPAPTVGGHR
jgi:hypothetical protein